VLRACFNTARELSWPKEGGSLVLIGDAEPHEPNYPANTNKLDWRQELTYLLERGIKVIPMQCLARYGSTSFWSDIAKLAQTPLLKLDDFAESAINLGAAVCASAGEDIYGHYMRSAPVAACVMGMSVNSTSNMAKFAAYSKGDIGELEKLNAEDTPDEIPEVSTTDFPPSVVDGLWKYSHITVPDDGSKSTPGWKATIHKAEMWNNKITS
jgi:hypothetical protein